MAHRNAADTEGTRTTRSVVIIGVLLVALGVLYSSAAVHNGNTSLVNTVISQVAVAIGGGVLGAGLNTVIVRRFERDVLEEITSCVEASLTARFVSSEQELRPLRRDWHHYYVSQVGRQRRWWSQPMPFGNTDGVGSIRLSMPVIDGGGRVHSYTAEAGVRSNTLIVLNTNDRGNENCSVDVYPAVNGYRTVYAGIAMLESWDGDNVVTRCLMSLEPLVAGSPGPLSETESAQLDQEWTDAFRSTVLLGD